MIYTEIHKVCPICGKEFITNRKNAIACSPECRRERERQRSNLRWRKYLDNNPKEQPAPMEGVCGWCGDTFIKSTSWTKYCCKSCAAKANAKKNSEWKKRMAGRTPPKEVPAPSEEKRKSTINELAAEARRVGLSYGRLQGMKYMERGRFG